MFVAHARTAVCSLHPSLQHWAADAIAKALSQVDATKKTESLIESFKIYFEQHVDAAVNDSSSKITLDPPMSNVGTSSWPPAQALNLCPRTAISATGASVTLADGSNDSKCSGMPTDASIQVRWPTTRRLHSILVSVSFVAVARLSLAGTTASLPY